MPVGGYSNNTSALVRFGIPKRSYAQLSAQKDQNLRYQTAMAEQARIDQQEGQAQILRQNQVLNQLKNLPFEAPDKQRVREWLKGRQKQLAQHIYDNYPGREGDFFAAEGEAWLQNTYGDLTSSDLYAMAEKNKKQVAMARDAMQKEHNLTGRFINGKYRAAEDDLLDYMNGKNPTYEFNGSYKPDAQFVYEHFAKMDNPYGSKFDQNAYAPAQDVLNVITGKMGAKQGADMYYRQFQNSKIPFKRYSQEDLDKYLLDVANTKSNIATRQANLGLAQSREARAQRKEARELVEDQAGASYLETVISSPVDEARYGALEVRNAGKNIPSLNIPLKSLSIPGENRQYHLDFDEYPGLNIEKDVKRLAGVAKGGQLKDVIIPSAGGDVLDLSKFNYKVVASKPNFYVDKAESRAATTEDRRPSRGFVSATVEIPRSELQAAKLERTRSFKEGRIIKKTVDGKEKDFVRIEVMAPFTNVLSNREIELRANKKAFPAKRALELHDAFQSSIDEALDSEE